MNTTTQLKINGFDVNERGHIACSREPIERWAHLRCAVIRLDVGDTKAAKEFSARVVASVDEPALVGTGRSGTVMLFRDLGESRVEALVGGLYDAAHDFIFDNRQCVFIATSKEQSVDAAAYQWRDGRSPLNTHRSMLPPLFSDISDRAYSAVIEHGGRWGTLADEAAARERLDRARAALAAHVEPSQDQLDQELVDANPHAYSADGIFGSMVAAARARLARRKAAA